MTRPMRSEDARGQVRSSAAEIYEEFFVPALFAQWTECMLEAAAVGRDARVLDVACGTGVLARAAAVRARTVTGLDVNPGMLDVARRAPTGIEWREGRAEALPFADGAFDAVLCQFGLMFFEDRVRALLEMTRVLRRGGRLALAVWDSLEHSPGYAAMAALLGRLFGEEAAGALHAPFCLGERTEIEALLAAAQLRHCTIDTREGVARFPSIASWVHTDINGWTLAGRIDAAQLARLQAEAARELRGFTTSDGTVTFAAPAHIVTATKE